MAGGSGVMLCLKCRYSLAALSRGVCPECGREFDPGDPGTFFVPRMFMVSAGWSRAPDWGHFLAGGIGSLILLAAYWNGRTNLLLVIIGTGAWLGVGGLVVIKAACRRVPPSRHRLRVPSRKFWRRVVALASIAMATWLLIWFEAPLKFRLRMHLLTLEAIASKLAAYEGNVLDEGRYPEMSGVVAAFKVSNGEVIEIRSTINRALSLEQ